MGLSDVLMLGGLTVGAYLVYTKIKSTPTLYAYNISTDGTTTYATNTATGIIEHNGTDSSKVINSVTSSGNIHITNGTYKIKSPVEVHSGFILDGEGNGTILQADTEQQPVQILQQYGYTDTDPFGIASNNITIRNIHFDGNSVANRCIQAKIDNCIIESCIFEKSTGFGLKIVRSNFPKIQNNIVLSSGSDGIHLLYCNNGTIKNNNVYGKNDDGIALALSQNTTVSGNYVNGTGSIAGSCYANWGGSNNTFSGNIGENEPNHHGINIVDYLGDYPNGITVSNNIFKNNAWAGVYINGTSGTDSITNTTIDNNQLINNGKYGIYIQRSGYGTIKNNILINNCGLKDKTYEQILIDYYATDYSTHWNIDGNTISSSLTNQPLYTIYIASTEQTYCNVTNNILSDASSRILQINDNRATVTGNQLCSIMR